MNWLLATIHKTEDELPKVGVPESVLRLVVATYLLGQMMGSSTEKINGDAKELKVQAAFKYADLLLKG